MNVGNSNLKAIVVFVLLISIFAENSSHCDELVCGDAVLNSIIHHALSLPIKEGRHADRVAELELLSCRWSMSGAASELSIYYSEADSVRYANVRWRGLGEVVHGREFSTFQAMGEMVNRGTSITSCPYKLPFGSPRMKRSLTGEVISSIVDESECRAIMKHVEKIAIPAVLPTVATQAELETLQKLMSGEAFVMFSFRSAKRKFVVISNLGDTRPDGLPTRLELPMILQLVEHILKGIEIAK